MLLLIEGEELGDGVECMYVFIVLCGVCVKVVGKVGGHHTPTCGSYAYGKIHMVSEPML